MSRLRSALTYVFALTATMVCSHTGPAAFALPFVPDAPYFFTGNPEGFPGRQQLDEQTTEHLIDAGASISWWSFNR